MSPLTNTPTDTMEAIYSGRPRVGVCSNCGGEVRGIYSDQETIQHPCPHEEKVQEQDWLEPERPIREFSLRPASTIGAFPNSLRGTTIQEE